MLPPSPSLKRELGIGGATMIGLGSMVGTGVFVSIGIAAGVAGPAVILAIGIAAVVAACNALSSAQLAASHPVSGGTYQYGYRYISPAFGFTAGWMFLCAKTASAAAAALGFAGYFLRLVGMDPSFMPWLAAGAVGLFTALVLAGIRRSSRLNMLIVSVTLLALAGFVLVGLPRVAETGGARLRPLLPADDFEGIRGFLYATALMFVAYTGYARIATLGEEVKEPRRTIPRAIIITLIVTASLYVLVAIAAIGTVGAAQFASAPDSDVTPLEFAARAMDAPLLAGLVSIGAVTAMLGVLLNLIMGLSRVVLAMGRQGDLPQLFARLSRDASAPPMAVMAVGIIVALLAFFGSLETNWAFSAFTVLIYYVITNLAALRLPRDQRLYPNWVAMVGLAACLFLAFWVPAAIWAIGTALILAGLAFKSLVPRLWQNRSSGG